MEPDNEAIVCENSIDFPRGAFIRMIKRIMRIIPPTVLMIFPSMVSVGAPNLLSEKSGARVNGEVLSPHPLTRIQLFSASFRNGLNRSIGMGKRTVELFSAAIVFKVWR